jgi:ATP-dependent exoDNAse (exonuclease V) beta subunit
MAKLVYKLKTLVSAAKGKIFKYLKQDTINENEAKKIQKTGYYDSRAANTKKYSPPYLSILEQLNDDSEQVFRSVVCKLTRIALNRKEYRAEILSHLEEHHSEYKRSRELFGYLALKISEIKNTDYSSMDDYS